MTNINIMRKRKYLVSPFFDLYRLANPCEVQLSFDEFQHSLKQTTILAAYENHHLRGFVTYYPNWGFVHLLYVDPAYQHRGIGTALLNAVIKARQATKYTHKLHLMCSITNYSAHQFYLDYGFKFIELTQGQLAMCKLFEYEPIKGGKS